MPMPLETSILYVDCKVEKTNFERMIEKKEQELDDQELVRLVTELETELQIEALRANLAVMGVKLLS